MNKKSTLKNPRLQVDTIIRFQWWSSGRKHATTTHKPNLKVGFLNLKRTSAYQLTQKLQSQTIGKYKKCIL